MMFELPSLFLAGSKPVSGKLNATRRVLFISVAWAELSYGINLDVDLDDEQATGELWLSASFAPQNLAKLEAAIRQEWQRALKEGFAEAELAAAKDEVVTKMAMSLSQDDNIAMALSRNLRLGRDMRYAEQRLAAYQALTLAQVNAAFRLYVQPERFIRVFAGDFK